MSKIKELPEPEFASDKRIIDALRKALRMAKDEKFNFIEIIARTEYGKEIQLLQIDGCYRSDWSKKDKS